MTMADTPKESELAGMQYALQLYQEKYESINTSMTRLMDEISSLRGVDSALSRLPGSAGKGAMINTGMGFMVGARVDEVSKAVVAIGGGILAEKSISEAKVIAADRIKARDEALKRLMNERKELERMIYELSYRIQESTA